MVDMEKINDEKNEFLENGTPADSDLSYYDEISKLNNELVNITRELTKKNIALEKASEKINHLLRTDHLTGIANRMYFMEYFTKAHSGAIRHSLPLTLVMVDIDDFKTINDSYGHQAGDEVLIAVAQLLQSGCRKEDLAARFGGEEFTILLVHTNAEQGKLQVERIRRDLENLAIGKFGCLVTASFGLSPLTDDGSIDNMISQADKALYQAKEKGKNRTIIYGEEV